MLAFDSVAQTAEQLVIGNIVKREQVGFYSGRYRYGFLTLSVRRFLAIVCDSLVFLLVFNGLANLLDQHEVLATDDTPLAEEPGGKDADKQDDNDGCPDDDGLALALCIDLCYLQLLLLVVVAGSILVGLALHEAVAENLREVGVTGLVVVGFNVMVLGMGGDSAGAEDDGIVVVQGVGSHASRYLLALAVIFVIYYIRAVRQYGRWLLDNYADLKRKEIWLSLVAITCILLMFVAYKVNYGGMLMEYVTQINTLIIIGFLLWRVETLQTLESSVPQTNTGALPMAIADYISTMLKERCEGKQLYLKHDLTLVELADAIETNRNYLSSYFAEQGTTYNNYINRLRIDHFISLYRETTEGNRSIAVLRLAERSGYKSYSTFSAAFKRITGLSETDWMKQCKK